MKVFLGIMVGYIVVSAITAKTREAKIREVFAVCEGE